MHIHVHAHIHNACTFTRIVWGMLGHLLGCAGVVLGTSFQIGHVENHFLDIRDEAWEYVSVEVISLVIALKLWTSNVLHSTVGDLDGFVVAHSQWALQSTVHLCVYVCVCVYALRECMT